MPLLIALIVATALALASRRTMRDGMITRHTFNNQYTDAPAARDEHLG